MNISTSQGTCPHPIISNVSMHLQSGKHEYKKRLRDRQLCSLYRDFVIYELNMVKTHGNNLLGHRVYSQYILCIKPVVFKLFSQRTPSYFLTLRVPPSPQHFATSLVSGIRSVNNEGNNNTYLTYF